MDQWLDSLSEDWISQPRSSHSNSLIKTPPGNSSREINMSQSRIPRYKTQSVSNGGAPHAKLTERRSSNTADLKKAALNVSSSSNINASQRRAQKGPANIDSPTSEPRQKSRREISTCSLPSARQDTVQHQPSRRSPLKEGWSPQSTPEWKRRVLQGDIVSGDQCDLFSPIGLEKVFKQPASASKTNLRGGPNQSTPAPKGHPPNSPYSSDGKIAPRPGSGRAGKNQPTISSSAKVLANVEAQRDKANAPSGSENPLETNVKKQNQTRARSGTAIPSTSTTSQQLMEKISHRESHEPQSSTAGNLLPRTLQPSITFSLQAASAPSFRKPLAGIEASGNITCQDFENISPFYVSRHHTGGGRIDYVAVDMSMHQLHIQMDELRVRQRNRLFSSSSDNDADHTNVKSVEDSFLRVENKDWTSHSLPEGLSAGTDVFAANGGFVNTRRGGYSNDGSFQRRPLSPSSSPSFETSRMKSSPSSSGSVVRDKKSKPPLQITPAKQSPIPRTPEKQRVNKTGSQERTRSSGSPLKLFEKYDTFTNDRLSRRMSKFEETIHQEQNRALCKSDGHGVTPKNSRSIADQLPKQQGSRRSQQRSKARLCSFGDGDLNGHNFTCERLSVSIHRTELDKDRGSNTTDRDPDTLRFEPDLNSSSQNRKSAKRYLSSSIANGSAPSVESTREDSGAQESVQTTIDLAQDDRADEIENSSRNAQGKRIAHSPAKNPQSKRRRTLQLSGVDHQLSQLTSALDVKPVVGRKRKDALYDGQSQAADPKILAKRQMLRPRSSTSSQNGFQGRIAHDVGAIEIEEGNFQSIETFQPAQAENTEVGRPTEELADELANFTLGMVNNITNDSRKASVTTADFFTEAQQIMKRIRAERLPQEIVEESEADFGEKEDFYAEESTKDEFSRPPSRDGVPRKQREPALLNPEVIGLLRQFEDEDDLGITLPSSLKSLHIKQPNQESDSIGNIKRNVIESDPPNVRILERNTKLDRGKFSTADTKIHSYGSQATSDPSTGHSLQGASSSGSRNKMIIAPATVSHLLSDQMGGMTFDREKQVWVKQKISSRGGNDLPNCAGSETTDRDLLGEIPDLSVDELEEIQRIKESAASFKGMGSNSAISTLDHAKRFEAHEDSHRGEESQDSRPQTAEGAPLPGNENSSVQSKFSRFASSGPIPETRATSWGDEVLQQKRSEAEAANSSTSSMDNQEEHDEEVEHEIKILEGRESRVPTHSNQRDHQPRVVTVAFSSPLVDQTQTPNAHKSGPESWDDDGDLIDDLDDSPIRFDSPPDRATMQRHSTRSGRRSTYRPTSRRVSLESRSYIARPMSRLDEEDEISFLQCKAGGPNVSLEVVLSTPLPFKRSTIGPNLPSTGQRSTVGFHLSPLADFTVHQTDASHLGRHDRANRRGLLALHEVEGGLSLATQNLVNQLTDIEPYEPYWDFIRSIDLQKRGLITLCMLNEYCPSIEELDVSDNTLAQLDGAPSSIRDLKICRNHLSDLTAWAHLQNLQYLDVSYNQIQSLIGFQALVHLRELVADGNQIESLDGVLKHDGLISLSLRRNRLKSVDFEDTNLKRLTHLDLRGNEVITVDGLHQLVALTYMDLSNFQSLLENRRKKWLITYLGDNQIQDLDPSPIPLSALKYLNVSNNHLATVNVNCMPDLQSLNLDQNSISHIKGLSTHKKLDTLCWRDQTLSSSDPDLPGLHYQNCQNIQTLYLSRNALSSFLAPTPFLDVHNLALASTGLKTLFPDFGHMMPNLRVLNLNYNALRDLRPLFGIVKLQKLYVAGNRISRLRQTAAVLEGLGQELVEVDLRRNPLTLGFYTPQESRSSSVSVPVERRMVVQKDNHPGDNYHNPMTKAGFEDDDGVKIDLLPAVDRDVDTIARARLDKDTSLRRRVYEILVVNACPGLGVLDGMEFDRHGVGRRDEVWERLMELGVLLGADHVKERGRVGDDHRKESEGDEKSKERKKARRRKEG